MDEEHDDDFSFIKVINAGRSFYVHNVNGHVQSRVVYFLMNIHLLPRSIYLSRVIYYKFLIFIFKIIFSMVKVNTIELGVWVAIVH